MRFRRLSYSSTYTYITRPTACKLLSLQFVHWHTFLSMHCSGTSSSALRADKRHHWREQQQHCANYVAFHEGHWVNFNKASFIAAHWFVAVCYNMRRFYLGADGGICKVEAHCCWTACDFAMCNTYEVNSSGLRIATVKSLRLFRPGKLKYSSRHTVVSASKQASAPPSLSADAIVCK